MNGPLFLESILLAIHLTCAGIGTFAPFYALVAEVIEARGSSRRGAATPKRREAANGSGLGHFARRFSIVGIGSLLLGGVIGLLYGYMVYEEGLDVVIRALWSRIFFGIIEYLFSLALVIGHLIWWKRRSRCSILERSFRCLMLFLAASNLAYHFPVLFEVTTLLQADPELFNQLTATDGRLSSSDFRQLVARQAVLSQSLHFLLAAVFSAGAAMLVVARVCHEDWSDPLGQTVQRTSGTLIAGAATLQLAVGTWVTVNERTEVTYAISDPNRALLWFFIISLLFAISVIPHGIHLTFRSHPRRAPLGIVFHCAMIILLMSVLTHWLANLE